MIPVFERERDLLAVPDAQYSPNGFERSRRDPH
jgi:hypothetical protein